MKWQFIVVFLFHDMDAFHSETNSLVLREVIVGGGVGTASFSRWLHGRCRTVGKVISRNISVTAHIANDFAVERMSAYA